MGQEANKEGEYRDISELTGYGLNNNIYGVKKFIRSNPDIIHNIEGIENCLKQWVSNNKTSAIETLITEVGIPEKIKKGDLLINACYRGFNKTVVALLKGGFNPNYISNNAQKGVLSPLSVAAQIGSTPVVKTLLKVGAHLDITLHGELLDAVTKNRKETAMAILEHYPSDTLLKLKKGEIAPLSETTNLKVFVGRFGKLSKSSILTFDNEVSKLAGNALKQRSTSKILDAIRKGDSLLEI
jgi:hypothetical protein